MQEFNYHSHTYRCKHADLDMTDEEYVQDYIKIGMKKIAFTDHCPEKNEIDKRKNMRMKYDEREEYLASIKNLRDKYADKIKIEIGYEVEYLPGEEENLLELKNETDKLILGQHFIYDDNKNLKIFGKADFTDDEIMRYAKYLEKAMELNIVDIVAHPDIYMFRRKQFGDVEKKAANIICKAAEKYDIPLEINLNKIFAETYYENKQINNYPIEEQRKKLGRVVYPCKEFWNVATNYNIRVLYGVDSHHRGQIQFFNQLVELANEILGQEIIGSLNFIKEEI